MKDQKCVWSTRNEVEILLELAREHEPAFEPMLRFLISTGTRRGEALGLRWEDIDFDRCRITIRRALTKGIEVTPKSGRSRVVAMSPTLAEALFDLLGHRRRENIRLGRPDVPREVFCSRTGTALDERNVTRTWLRLRRPAAKLGVRPLRLHAARHTFASLAIASGRSVRFLAEQLGHADPAFTLRTYAHLMPSESEDMTFADFTPSADGTKRHQTALLGNDENEEVGNYATTNERMARPVRLERTTLGSASRCSIQLSYGRAGILRVGSE